MEPWYKVATPRKEVREGRSFNPDEFAIALEQVVAGTAPQDYCDPKLFFSRTCFTRALCEHTGMTLRRLAGKTENTAPVLALITQSGGGKTHTLPALYHLIKNKEKAKKIEELSKLLKEAGLPEIPNACVGVFVGNAWDSSWCFERRAQLPPEWTAVDTATTEAKAREYLQKRFEACYPFHPSTLSVFQRKWSTLPQYQQTRGTLAMFAQWISMAYREGYQKARREPLLTLGSAPLDLPEFRGVVLSQLGEPRLLPAMDEVWGGYRFAVIYDSREADGLKAIDLGAGHASSGETLCGRIIAALKSQALLNESVGAGYLERNWPPALKQSGAWPLAGLRQSFLNGSLTRLIDPDSILRHKIVEFVGKGDLGLASGQKPDGTYDRVWFEEQISSDEVTFESGVFLLTKAKAKALKRGLEMMPGVVVGPGPEPVFEEVKERERQKEAVSGIQTRTLRLVGTVPPEIWNRLGTKIIPKLKSGSDVKIGVDFSVTVNADSARSVESDLRQIIEDLGLKGKIQIE
jgi:hypothetical protein